MACKKENNHDLYKNVKCVFKHLCFTTFVHVSFIFAIRTIIIHIGF